MTIQAPHMKQLTHEQRRTATGLSSFSIGSSKVVLLLRFLCCISLLVRRQFCSVCFVNLCSSSLHLLVPQEDNAS